MDFRGLGESPAPLLKGDETMKDHHLRTKNLVLAAVVISFFSLLVGLLGCGVSITQQVALRAVEDAQIAVESAKQSRAQLYSANNMKRAQRLLEEAEEALSRNRKQRAYTFAIRAEEAANAAAEEANQYLGDDGVTDAKSYQVPGQTQTIDVRSGSPAMSTTTMRQDPGHDAKAKPQGQETLRPSTTVEFPEVSQLEIPELAPTATAPPGMSLSDMQSRIQIAIQALEQAQSAVLAARSLMLRTQVEIGLSMSDSTIQKAHESGASVHVINVIKSWYDHARRSAELGNYEDAMKSIEQAQIYAQTLTVPVK